MDDSSPYEPVAPNRHPDAFRLASISSGITAVIISELFFLLLFSIWLIIFFLGSWAVFPVDDNKIWRVWFDLFSPKFNHSALTGWPIMLDLIWPVCCQKMALSYCFSFASSYKVWQPAVNRNTIYYQYCYCHGITNEIRYYKKWEKYVM